MPITRRKRANPPEQSENNTTVSAETTENGSATPAQAEDTSGEAEQKAQPSLTPTVHRSESNAQVSPPIEAQPSVQPSVTYATNGERPERSVAERTGGERQEGPIESGRRTARGELFRRPPQVPPQAVQPTHTPAAAPPLPPPSHEITLPLGNLLHLSYNPGYTGADEARSELLEQLVQESKKGGRARCWNCGSVAIVYDRWNTRSKTFGEVGVAICEICGVWSVM